MIKHFPVTNTDKVIEYYSEKDGMPIKYVCTTDFNVSDRPVDIFYRETAHPQFGNKYFGIAPDYETGGIVIFNADKVEKFTFGMVEDDDGDLQYSQYHHDYKSFNNGNMIDGGRQYVRSSLNSQIYVIRDGQFILSLRKII
jgi:hypothetical protein